MKTLREFYVEHKGKVSDKWSIYLSEYDRLFANFRLQPVRMLEIGIQNGGSLEIWSEFFPNAQIFVGCDINTDCEKLSYDDTRIQLVIGDANSDDIEKKIISHSRSFDLIIDDGSHTSGDIIKSFARYFSHLNHGGVFVVEDLHCSYWQEFEGGVYYPYSSMAFFKRLADVINHEHWGVEKSRSKLLQGIAEKYLVDFDELDLASVHSIEFFNSACIVRKTPPASNVLGRRFISGKQEVVKTGHLQLQGYLQAPPQNSNTWATMNQAPEEAWLSLKAELADRHDEIERLKHNLAERDAHISELLNSTSWKLTAPLRRTMHGIRGIKRLLRHLLMLLRQSGGLRSIMRKVSNVYSNEGLQGLWLRVARIFTGSHYTGVVLENRSLKFPAPSRSSQTLLNVRVLIIAELSIPQCTKYRVTQKQEMLQTLGVDSTVVSWVDPETCISALATHSLVIFYRVPAFSSVRSIISEAKRLQIPTVWEVDDLIFDKDLLAKSKSLKDLDKATFDGLLSGAELYRTAMLSCDQGIASTQGLATAMQTAGLERVHVIENALDHETLAIAERLFSVDRVDDGLVRIIYGSGTNTHNIDFKEAAPALVSLLKKHEHLRFRLVGHLNLPDAFDEVISKVERIPFCDYAKYLEYLATSDINIAPLENSIFNDSKSNIKYLEASILGIPSVCSPRAAFVSAISNQENGYLCKTADEWYQALSSLIRDPGMRRTMGLHAREMVLQQYVPEQVACVQLYPLLKPHARTAKLRILAINVYYSPRNFGGATVVAEEVNRILSGVEDVEVYILTTLGHESGKAYSLKRYEVNGNTVFGLVLPSSVPDFENSEAHDALMEVFAAVKPNIVHLHSIQGLGVTATDLCVKQRIPYVVTLHDTWWLCARQFMIPENGVHCVDAQINNASCMKCTSSTYIEVRTGKLADALSRAVALLAPSKFIADLYEANGFGGKRMIMNINGVKKPADIVKIKREGRLRFAYVGGNTRIKGVHLIKKVFSSISPSQAELVVVDNCLNLGHSSFEPNFFKSMPNVDIVPAYTQKGIDSFFSDIDVLLFPTQCKESFGLTVREALVRNVWVITTDAGGVVEDMKHGDNGFIIPFDDDGKALKHAVLDTIERYSRIPTGTEIHLQNPKIRYFDEQAEELLPIYKNFALPSSHLSEPCLKKQVDTKAPA